MPRPLSVTVTKPSAVHLDFDPVGVAGERLVHGVVDHLGEQVMQRLLVGAADIHAGPPAHRLEPFEHLDVARAVTRITAASAPCPSRAWRGGAALLELNRSPVLPAGFFAVLPIDCCLIAVWLRLSELILPNYATDPA